MKRPWQSMTVWFNGLGLGVLFLSPEVHLLVCTNKKMLAVIMLLNLMLRFKTNAGLQVKNPATLLLLLLVLSGCASVSDKLDKNVFYKRDAGAQINGQTYEGVVSVPYAKSYDFVFYPKGSIDVLLIRTCHREFAAEKITAGWFGKNKFHYVYTPIPGIEDVRVCPLRLDTYESSKEGRHSWLLADFETPLNKLPFTMYCNGVVSRINGVAVCQSKEQTYQRVVFDEPVMVAPVLPESCNKPVQKDAAYQVYEIKASLGECLFTFESRSGAIARMTMIAYDGIAIRAEQ